MAALKKVLSRRTVCILLLLALALLLLPMLYIARFDIPSADDFHYGIPTHKAYEDTGSLLAVLSAAAEKTAYTYRTWQGTFSAVFLMTMQPGIYGEGYYSVTPFIMLAALLGGIFLLCRSLLGGVFGANKYAWLSAAAAASILCTQFVPTPAECFYWYNGAVYYTFYFGLTLITAALLLDYVRAPRRRWGLAATAALLLAVISGGNYVTALLTAELLFLGGVLLAVQKNGRRWDMGVFFALFMAGFLISVLAPGNAQRQALITERPGLAQAILQCFTQCAADIALWTTLPVVAMLLLMVPVFGAAALRTEYRFPLPLAVTALSYCLLSSMYCPPLYAQGYLPWRITDIIFFAYMLALGFNVFYWTGWLLRRYEKLSRLPAGIPVWLLLAFALLFAAGTGLTVRRHNVSSAYAAVALYNGGAESYYQAAQARFALLHDPDVRELELDAFEYRPALLFFSDVSDDPDEARNRAMCEYYGKDKIWLSTPGSDYWE